MQLPSQLPVLLISFIFVEAVVCCSCPESSQSAGNDTILTFLQKSYQREYYSAPDIYTGTVVEATCKCYMSPTMAGKYQWQCLTFTTVAGSDNSTTAAVPADSTAATVAEKRRFTCENKFMYIYAKFRLGKFDCENVFGMALGDRNYSMQNSLTEEVETVPSCNFRGYHSRNDAACGMSFQPCTYAIKVKEVFKGNYKAGDIVHINGPRAMTRCTGGPTMLEVGQSYMMGIGSMCSKYHHEWSQESVFTEDEMNILRYLRNSQSATKTDTS